MEQQELSEQEEADALWEEMTRKPEPRGLGAPVVAGLITSVVVAAIWALVATLTGMEFGYAALGLGAAVGGVMVATARVGSARLGKIAAVLAILGLLAAKFMIMEFGLPRRLAAEIAMSQEMTSTAVFNMRAARGLVDQDIVDWYETSNEDEEPPPELKQRFDVLMNDIGREMRGLTVSEREELVRPVASIILSKMPLSSRLSLSVWDLVWLALAMGAAHRLASGGSLLKE